MARKLLLVLALVAVSFGSLHCVGDDPVQSPVTPSESGAPDATATDAAAEASLPVSPDGSAPVVDADATTDAPSEGGPHLFLFVTSDTMDGNLGGVEAADTLCSQRGQKLRNGGAFKAWLGSSTRPDFGTLLPPGRVWYSADDKTLLATSTSLTDGTGLKSGLMLDETLGTVAENAFVWTGLLANGKASALNCNGWTSTTGDGELGAVQTPGPGWTESTTSSCSFPNHLVCIELPK